MRVAFLPILVLLPLLARAADAPPATTVAEMRYARREVRIEGDHTHHERLITATAQDLAERAGLSPQQLAKALHSVVIIDQRGAQWTLTLTLPREAEPAAREFLDELIARVREALVEDALDAKTRELAELHPQLEAAEKQRAAAEETVRRRRAELHQVADRADVSAAGIQSAISGLEEERQRLELDVLGKTARREALEEEIAKQTEQAAKKIDDDPIAAELRRVVEVREEQLKRVERMHEAGQVPRVELDETMAKTAEVRARLLERQQQAAAEAGGDMLQSFSRELLTLSVDLRELNARLKFVMTRLDRLRQATELREGLSQAESELVQPQAEVANYKETIRIIEQRQPPRLEVLSRDNRAEPPKMTHESQF